MRKSMTAAIALGASAALVGGFTYGSAEAYTQKELKLCWADTTGGTGTPMGINVVADGPSYRTAALASGQCAAYDVRPGRYKITLANVNDFLAEMSDACDGVPGGQESLKIRVKRQNKPYQVYNLAAWLDGAVETNVRNNRATTVSAHLRCV